MDPYASGEDSDEGLLGEIRKIGASGARGATFAPRGASADLGEDILEIRMRAKGAEGGEGAQARYEAARRAVQVDLNDESHLDDLEDRGLVEHMRQARRQRQQDAEQEAHLPSREALLRSDTEGRRALSSLMTRLKEQQMALQCASDEVHAHAANAGRLSRNEQPHGYPAVGPPPSGATAACLAHLEKKLLAAVADLAGISAALEGFERDLTLARRSYEGTVDGLRRRGEHYEGRPAEKGGD